jgi:hypothetical protein
MGDAKTFNSGREFAAWLGLLPGANRHERTSAITGQIDQDGTHDLGFGGSQTGVSIRVRESIHIRVARTVD